MRPAPASIPKNNDKTMKFKVIFDIDTETEVGSTAECYSRAKCHLLDEKGSEIKKLPTTEALALAFHLSRGAANLLENRLQVEYLRK